MTPTTHTTTIYAHPSDRLVRRALTHFVGASALAGAVRELPDRFVLKHPVSGGQATLWAFACSLAEQGGLLFSLRDTDEECRRAATEALAIWCGVTVVPVQRTEATR